MPDALPAFQPRRPWWRRPWGWMLFLLLGWLGWSGWQEYDFRGAVREAEAAGFGFQQKQHPHPGPTPPPATGLEGGEGVGHDLTMPHPRRPASTIGSSARARP